MFTTVTSRSSPNVTIIALISCIHVDLAYHDGEFDECSGVAARRRTSKWNSKRNAVFEGDLRAEIVGHDILHIRREDVIDWYMREGGGRR